VYRQGYPLYRYFISLLKDRAARISKEELKLLDGEGNLCLGESAEMKMLDQEIDDNLVKFTYSLSIDHGSGMTWPTKIDGTINLQDPITKFFAVTTRAQYCLPIVAGTKCTQIECTVKAAMAEKDWKPKVTTQPGNTTQTRTQDRTRADEQANQRWLQRRQSDRLNPPKTLSAAKELFAFPKRHYHSMTSTSQIDINLII